MTPHEVQFPLPPHKPWGPVQFILAAVAAVIVGALLGTLLFAVVA
jgi:hypothetical protein